MWTSSETESVKKSAGESGRRISEALLDAVAPFMPRGAPADHIRAAALAAASIWNGTRRGVQPGERRENMEEAERLLATFIGRRARVKRVIEAMGRQLRRGYADDTRRILDVRFTPDDRDGNVRLVVLSDGTEDDGLATPFLDDAGRLLDATLGNETTVSPTVRRYVLKSLQLLAGIDDDAPRRRSVAVWTAGAVHAAFQMLPGPRLTADVLAARFGVKLHHVRQASLDLRRAVDRDWIRGDDPVRTLRDLAEHMTSRDVCDAATAANARAVFARLAGIGRLQPPGSFRFDAFVAENGIPAHEADVLWHSLLTGIRDAVHDRRVMDVIVSPARDAAIEGRDADLCICFAAALREYGLSEETRVLVACQLAARFFDPDARDGDLDVDVPPGGLLPVIVLARAGTLAGADLLVATRAVCAHDVAVSGVLAGEVVDLAAVIDAVEQVPAADRAGAIVQLFALAVHPPAAFESCVNAFAMQSSIPPDRRCAVLDSLADRAYPGRALPPSARRSAALARASLEDSPLAAAARLLERAGTDGSDRAWEHAAADLLDKRNGDIDVPRDADALRAVLRAGIASSAPTVRRRFHEIGLRLLGDEALAWARADRAAANREWAEKQAARRNDGSGDAADGNSKLGRQMNMFEV